MEKFIGSDEKLENRIKHQTEQIEKVEKFYQWFNSQANLIKKEIVQVADEMIGGDWRAYSLKQAKKDELKDKVKVIYDRTVGEGKLVLEILEIEKSKREFAKLKQEQINTDASLLHDILDAYLLKNPNGMDQRQLDCLVELIDSGTVSTVGELAEYGVEN